MSASLNRLTIELDGVPVQEASGLAAELREYLLDENPGLEVQQVRSDLDTQDLGATLVILLGPPAVLALARGVQRWIERRSTSKVVFQSANGQLTVTNLSGRRADELGRELVLLMRGTRSEESA